MQWSRVLSFDDPCMCRAAISSADVELFPTAKGRFHTDITQIGMNGLWMHRIQASLPQISTIKIKSGRRSIGFLTESSSAPLSHAGMEILPGDIVLNNTDVAHQRSGADFRFGTVSLPLEDLAATAEITVGRGLPEKLHKITIRPASTLMNRLLNLHKSMGRLAHDAPDVLEVSEVRRALHSQLVHFVVKCLADGLAIEPSARSRRHNAIVERFEEFLEANSDRPLYLMEICAALGVAERTLRACCEEHLGMGPIRYLTLRRMHLVRRALQRSNSAQSTITGIVTDHGFWELGRFAVAYRALFGEPPSATLRRQAVELPLKSNRPSSFVTTELANS